MKLRFLPWVLVQHNSSYGRFSNCTWMPLRIRAGMRESLLHLSDFFGQIIYLVWAAYTAFRGILLSGISPTSGPHRHLPLSVPSYKICPNFSANQRNIVPGARGFPWPVHVPVTCTPHHPTIPYFQKFIINSIWPQLTQLLQILLCKIYLIILRLQENSMSTEARCRDAIGV